MRIIMIESNKLYKQSDNYVNRAKCLEKSSVTLVIIYVCIHLLFTDDSYSISPKLQLLFSLRKRI